MQHRDSEHFSAKNLVKKTLTADGTETPDLNTANVFRYSSASYNLAVGNPTNGRDGQYIRIEVLSAGAKTVNFGTAFHVNGAIIADANHDAHVLVNYQGYYNADTAKWNVVNMAQA